ncbi:MAG: DegV family protein [Ruminococcaceae bacterium]|nr:DegV family protein [Oscillospiraceae bacterium]
MSKKVILTIDSTCDLSEELIQQYNIDEVFPLHVLYGDQSFDDGINMFPDEIYKRFYDSGTLPTTAAISIGEYLDHFRPYVENGCEVIHISLGSSLSCSHANARAAAEMLEGVYVIDSRALSTGSGLIALEASDRIAQGMCAKDIADELNKLTDKNHASFILDTLRFLAAGGRCSAVAAFGANVLGIKPSIAVDNAKCGSMGVAKKFRGKFPACVEQYVNDQLDMYSDIVPKRIFITHSGIDEAIIESVRAILKNRGNFENIYVTRAGCTISSHCGPNCIGVLFMTES